MAEWAYGAGAQGASSLDSFKQVKLLGEGAFAAVFKVIRYADGQTYALKKVKLPSLSDKEKQNALNEIRLLASVQQENIVSYKDAFFDDKTRCLCIVTECCDGGDLMEQITRCQKERSHVPESDIWRWMNGLGHALKALHGMSIFHRDMKSANVFLHATRKGRVAKLGDFNVSTVAKKGLCLTQTGTPYYASPEIWRDMPYDGKSDMWGLGCVMYEAAFLKPPFRAEDMEGLAQKVCRGRYKRIPAIFSDDLSDVISLLLQVNPRHRPSPAQFLMLPIIRKHAIELNLAEDIPYECDLLSTIKVPRRLIDLSAYLPSPQYDIPPLEEEEEIMPSPSVAKLSPCAKLISPSSHSMRRGSSSQCLGSGRKQQQQQQPAAEHEGQKRCEEAQQRRAEEAQQQQDDKGPSRWSLAPIVQKGRGTRPQEAPRQERLPGMRQDSRQKLPGSRQDSRQSGQRRRVAGSQPPPRRRRDSNQRRPAAPQEEAEYYNAPVDREDSARGHYMQKTPQELPCVANLLPQIQFAPSKARPEPQRLKLPRIGSCPGQLV